MSVVRFHFKKAAIFSDSNFKALIFLFSCGGGWGVTEIYKEHLPLGWVVYEIYQEHAEQAKKLFFIFLHQNICCGCSKEPS